MKAMVLAAGLGIRLRPLTESVPKPLLPVGPYPLLVWNLLLLRRHGIEYVMIKPALPWGADQTDVGRRLALEYAPFVFARTGVAGNGRRH